LRSLVRSARLFSRQFEHLARLQLPLPSVPSRIPHPSGGGKSTLIAETLYKALAKRLNNAPRAAPVHGGLEGVEFLDKISISTSRRSAARRARTRRPIPAALRRSATGSPGCPRPNHAAICPAASRSTSRAGAARPVRATASSRSRCTFCPTSMSNETSARAGATTARPSRCYSAARTSPTCST
jgi:excinuclease ABC subunit A